MAVKKNKVALLCAWGEGFGTGHIQRMATLCQYLIINKGIDCSIVSDKEPVLGRFFNEYLSKKIPDDTTLIIHDMRDSSNETISGLKKIAPVIVIDDCGEGRLSSDLAVDLLPNLLYEQKLCSSEISPFIYGYNFCRAIESLDKSHSFEKNIDYFIYTGLNPSDLYLSFIRSVIPEKCTAVIADGIKTEVISDKKISVNVLSYPMPLIHAKNVVTHFGITLFEAKLCGCKLFTINPTAYHSKLCGKAKDTLGLINFGEFNECDAVKIKGELEIHSNLAETRVAAEMLQSKIDQHLESFFNVINLFIF